MTTRAFSRVVSMAAVLAAVPTLSLPATAQATGAPRPGAANLERLLEFIRPAPDELTYEGIGWRNRFWPAVEEARALGRPILLWTMNGHPLGCT